jgi:hypothetical protein
VKSDYIIQTTDMKRINHGKIDTVASQSCIKADLQLSSTYVFNMGLYFSWKRIVSLARINFDCTLNKKNSIFNELFNPGIQI